MKSTVLANTRRFAMLLAALSMLAPAAASASAGLAGRPLHQVALTATDLPRAIAFYRDTLGLPLLFESNGMAFFDIAGTRLMIAFDPGRAKAAPTSILYFDAPSFDATLARLGALGVRFEGKVETVQRGRTGDLKLQQFVDPDGNALAIMGLVPKP